MSLSPQTMGVHFVLIGLDLFYLSSTIDCYFDHIVMVIGKALNLTRSFSNLQTNMSL